MDIETIKAKTSEMKAAWTPVGSFDEFDMPKFKPRMVQVGTTVEKWPEAGPGEVQVGDGIHDGPRLIPIMEEVTFDPSKFDLKALVDVQPMTKALSPGIYAREIDISFYDGVDADHSASAGIVIPAAGKIKPPIDSDNIIARFEA